MALTAYAVRFLTDAADVIPVDEDVLKKAREWLIKQQRPDGRWAQNWRSSEDHHRSAVLTAYVARVLSTSADSAAAASVKRALNYLSRQGIAIDEPYLLPHTHWWRWRREMRHAPRR